MQHNTLVYIKSQFDRARFRDVLLSYFERPHRDHILLNNFRLIVSGYYFPAVVMDLEWWGKVKNIIESKSTSSEAVYFREMKKLTAQAFIFGGCYDYNLNRRSFVDTVFQTLTAAQIDELDKALLTELEHEYRLFDVEDYFTKESISESKRRRDRDRN